MAILKYDQVSLPGWSPSAFINAGTNAINSGLTNISNALKDYKADVENEAKNQFMAGLANQADTNAAQQYIAANQSLLQRAGAQTAMDAMAKRSGLITDVGRLLENQKAQEAIDAQNELNAYGNLRAQIKEKILKGDTAGLAALMQKANGMGLRTNTINKLFEGDPLDSQYKRAQIYGLGLTNRDKQLQLNIAPAIDYLSTNWGNAKTIEEQQGVYNHALSLLKTPEERNAFRLAIGNYGYKPMEGDEQYTPDKVAKTEIDPEFEVEITRNGQKEYDKVKPGITDKLLQAQIAAGEAEADRKDFGFNASQYLTELKNYDKFGSDTQAMFVQLAKDMGIPEEDRSAAIGEWMDLVQNEGIAPAVVAATQRTAPASDRGVTNTVRNFFNPKYKAIDGGIAIRKDMMKRLQKIYEDNTQYGAIIHRRAQLDKGKADIDEATKLINATKQAQINAHAVFARRPNNANKRLVEAADRAYATAQEKYGKAYVDINSVAPRTSGINAIPPIPAKEIIERYDDSK